MHGRKTGKRKDCRIPSPVLIIGDWLMKRPVQIRATVLEQAGRRITTRHSFSNFLIKIKCLRKTLDAFRVQAENA
jgi:hypothetical protein